MASATWSPQIPAGADRTGPTGDVGASPPSPAGGGTHAMIVQDVARVQNRIKALLRSRGVAVAGKSVYSEKGREEFLEKLPHASRGAATVLYAQYDAVKAKDSSHAWSCQSPRGV
ncbi:hypothetical protein WMF11_39395 [Sorangium sp. So ce295]|uniref:hypothetical protein n=1 Tax=Sorangium sp. So ce295 TaxID=3133295 RepID=UPI003F630CAD